MILIGQYDSPYVRRVAVSLPVLGFDYQYDTRSVFGDFDAMLRLNPLGRIPSLAGRFPSLDALSVRCEARPEFEATYPAEYVMPGSGR